MRYTNYMKGFLWLAGVVVVAVGGFFVLNSYLYQEKQQQFLTYQNDTYGYTVTYPDTLEAKEYIPENVVLGVVDGEAIHAVVELRVFTVEGEQGETFIERASRELMNLCAADGPRGSLSCVGVASQEVFEAESGFSGTKLYLTAELQDFAASSTETFLKGPYYVFLAGTNATASRAMVVHAPLARSATEADGATIEMVAKSVVLGDALLDPNRYMDIETYIRNTISEISPVKEQLGGTFYVTNIETGGGVGSVEYEDGHNAYVADFTYEISADGKPEVLTFTLKE